MGMKVGGLHDPLRYRRESQLRGLTSCRNSELTLETIRAQPWHPPFSCCGSQPGLF